MLQAMPSLVDINIAKGNHFTVCGDVHGQVIHFFHIHKILDQVLDLTLNNINIVEG